MYHAPDPPLLVLNWAAPFLLITWYRPPVALTSQIGLVWTKYLPPNPAGQVKREGEPTSQKVSVCAASAVQVTGVTVVLGIDIAVVRTTTTLGTRAIDSIESRILVFQSAAASVDPVTAVEG